MSPGTTQRRRRVFVSIAGVLVGASVVTAAAPVAATPDAVPLVLAGPPVYEIEGDWIAPPAEVATGDPVVAQWYVNVNDSGNPPGNDPVENITATFTVGNGRFANLPDMCRTADVAPVSEISADGLSLTCNLGTLNAGTAVAIQTPVVTDGPSGSTLSIAGSIAGQTVAPLPIPIVNEFGMDIAWEGATSFREYGAGYVDVDLEWTLFLAAESEAGPDSVTYELTVTDGLAAGVEVGPNACAAYTGGGWAVGHPWSGGSHPAEQVAPFVDSCTLTQVDGDTFELTLTGIDYSLAQVPTTDSAGLLLPTDTSAIASGSVWFRILSTANNSITLESNTPTYTSLTGATAVDDPDNNGSNKTITRGGWSNAWRPEAMGIPAPSWWSNQLYVSPGMMLDALTTHQLHLDSSLEPDDVIAQCVILDTRWVTYDSHYLYNSWGGRPVANSTIEYYVGADPTVDPSNAGYDPNAFACADDPGGWTTTVPTDLTTVKAVRATYPYASLADADPVNLLNVRSVLHDDVPIGQDVWEFGELGINDVWQRPSRTLDPTDGTGPRTPGMRYPYIGSGRDVLYVIDATPAIDKAVEPPVVRPGAPATFTLTYSANGTGAIDPTVDGYTIVDTLPFGMTYVEGSASLAPADVSTNPDGQQVLTWNLDDVPTNTLQTLTYQAGPDAGIAGGTRLTNSAVAEYNGQSSRPATATVTTSTNGYTSIVKMATDSQMQITDTSGVVELPWTVTIASVDPLPQAFTDTIDILPYVGDGRGTDFAGHYALDEVVTPNGGTVYYTTEDPATLTDDPADASNGAANAPSAIWTTTAPADPSTVTAIRVLGPELAPGATFEFQLVLVTSDAEPGDAYVNRAQARAENTTLVMRTSAAIDLYQDVLTKELSSLVRQADGTYDAVFTISNTRTGNGPGYDLTDTLQYGDSVTLNGDPVAANTDPSDGSIAVVNTYDAATTTLTIADDVPIADGVTHVYTVTSNVSVDGATVSFEGTNCALEGNEAGTGLLNTATLTVEDVQSEADACAELPYVEHEKSLTDGPDPNGDGTYAVEYTIDVRNRGAGEDVYDLIDDFHFGAPVTIVGTPTVANVVPGGIDTLGTWNQAATTLAVVTDEPIAGSTASGPTTHTYVVSVDVRVSETGRTPANLDCTLAAGENGTGLFNRTTLTVGDQVTHDDACGTPPPPSPPPPPTTPPPTTVPPPVTPPPTAPPGPPDPGQLPSTGGNSTPLMQAAAVALVLGLALLIVRRRRPMAAGSVPESPAS